MVWEGEEEPQAGPDELVALEAYAIMHNGMGGVDWSALPLVCELFGVRDVELLVHRLVAIKRHRVESAENGDS